jgi:hypothetical protein
LFLTVVDSDPKDTASRQRGVLPQYEGYNAAFHQVALLARALQHACYNRVGLHR